MDTRLVTIFGGAGFVGRNTVRALAKAGWRIRVASRHPNMGFFLRPHGPGRPDRSAEMQHRRCRAGVAAAVQGSDAVINLVGIAYGNFEDAHVTGAETVARAAASTGVRALGRRFPPSAPIQRNRVFALAAQTKAEGEKRVRAAFPAATILRPSIIFGPEDGFFNKFAGLARFVPALPLIGGGKTRFQPVFVGDVAAALVAVLNNDAARGRTYELGGPTVYSFRQLMAAHAAGNRAQAGCWCPCPSRWPASRPSSCNWRRTRC